MHLIKPAIVIVGYNRPEALARLLDSVMRAEYDCVDIPLVISLDGEGDRECEALANRLHWKYGEKRVIVRERRLGLRNHILSCGDLTEEYGAIVLLEEDLGVASSFYHYATSAITFYQNEKRVAGVALYSYEYSELGRFRFNPIHDGFDNYFMQWPCSWGQAWTVQQWQGFRTWYDGNHDADLSSHAIPESVKLWPRSSWKRYFAAYLKIRNLYFVYPRISQSTNFGDSGVHQRKGFVCHGQVSLALKAPKAFRLAHLIESLSIYDIFFQLDEQCLKRMAPWVSNFSVTIDLEGLKPISNVSTPHLLSTRSCRKPVRSFDLSLRPYELNVIYECMGTQIHLGRKEDFAEKLTWLRDYNFLARVERVIAPMDYPRIILSRLYIKALEIINIRRTKLDK